MVGAVPDSLNLVGVDLLELARPDHVSRLGVLPGRAAERYEPVPREGPVRPPLADEGAMLVELQNRLGQRDLAEEFPLASVGESAILGLLASNDFRDFWGYRHFRPVV